MTPLQPGNKYFQTGLGHPVFDGGELITMTTTAGQYGELTLYGVGAEPFVPSTPQADVERNVDLALVWPAAKAGARTQVFVTMTIDQHGSTPVALICDFEDTGSGTVPASVINQWLDFGVTGFPNGRASRRTVDSDSVSDGCMEFVVERVFELDVRVVGHTPCKKPDDCPSGQTCNLLVETCE